MNNYIHPPIRTELISFFKKTSGDQFVIPVYQRNYIWKPEKEVKKYLLDLKGLLDKKNKQHFLGIIIYLTKLIDGFATTEFSVIDGQQRLTTTFLILYAIRDILEERGQLEDSKKLENNILTNVGSSEKYRLKLKPLVSDDNVYKKIVNREFIDIDKKEEQSNVYQCYLYIKSFINNELSNYTINEILAGLNQFYIVGVPISENDDAQKIFESINSTGAKLTASDLIRNFILMDLQSDIQEKYYFHYWKKIENNINSDSKKLENFFRFYLAIKTYKLSNTSVVYDNFKIWLDSDKKQNMLELYFEDILNYSKYFNLVYLKDLNQDIDSKKYNFILEYRKNLSEMPAPLLLESLRLHLDEKQSDKNRISFEDLKKIFEITNIYLIRRSICGLDTSDITRMFPTVLKEVMVASENDITQFVNNYKKILINKNRGKSAFMPDNDYLRNYLRTSNLYNLRLPLRIVFEKIENNLNSAPVDQSRLSVEHLMPQTPTQEWLDDTGCSSVEEYERYLNKLGNLTLASKSDNSKMQNRPFEYKQAILLTTNHLKLNEEIIKKEKWNKEAIDERTEKLIDKIIELYPYVSAPENLIIKTEIFLEFDKTNSEAILYEDDGSVEILAGSVFPRNKLEGSFDENEEYYQELLIEGIIKDDNDKHVLTKNITFYPKNKNGTALSLAASFVLRAGNRNGWHYWKDKSKKSLNENKSLKNKLSILE
jgi:uncharacterized protein with ParB-like and HNH nuclease domain